MDELVEAASSDDRALRLVYQPLHLANVLADVAGEAISLDTLPQLLRSLSISLRSLFFLSLAIPLGFRFLPAVFGLAPAFLLFGANLGSARGLGLRCNDEVP
jgi:hypothetical protein